MKEFCPLYWLSEFHGPPPPSFGTDVMNGSSLRSEYVLKLGVWNLAGSNSYRILDISKTHYMHITAHYQRKKSSSSGFIDGVWKWDSKGQEYKISRNKDRWKLKFQSTPWLFKRKAHQDIGFAKKILSETYTS